MAKSIVRQKKRPTLHDVSRLAKVSNMTVSNVVNKRYQFVGAKTRARVEKTIKELNYRPNPTSRRLRSLSALSVGMVIVDDAPAFLKDPFITEIVAGLSNHLSINNYTLSIQGVHPDHFQEAGIFTSIGVDALCLMICGSLRQREESIRFLETLELPIVLLQETLEIENENFAIINQDDYSGGRMIATYVLAKGAKNLLLLVPSMEWPAIRERQRGIVDAVTESGGAASVAILVCPDEDFSQTQIVLSNYLRDQGRPDAVLGSNDSLAVAALKHLQSAGINVPGDVLVTGFNGFEGRRYTTPTLTTVISPAYEMGQHAGAMIIRKLQTHTFWKRKSLYSVRFQQGDSA